MCVYCIYLILFYPTFCVTCVKIQASLLLVSVTLTCVCAEALGREEGALLVKARQTDRPGGPGPLAPDETPGTSHVTRQPAAPRAEAPGDL